VVAPCSACYLNLAKADHYMQERPSLGVKVNEALAAGDLQYTAGTLDVRHLIDILVYDVGLEKIRRCGGSSADMGSRSCRTWAACCRDPITSIAGRTMNIPPNWMTCCARWART
jgi:hypothetical protein